MKIIKKFFLSIIVLFTSVSVFSNDSLKAPSTYLVRICSSPDLRKEFSGFLEQVLRQVNTQDFYGLIDTILKKDKPKTDAELYEKLIAKVGTIKPLVPFISFLQSLAHQKKFLSKQVKQLLGKPKKIDGCLEIGTPGTYISTLYDFTTVNGPTYVLNEKKKASDFFQTLSFNIKSFFPNKVSVPLNEYNPIKEQDIPNNCLDLVICFIGLHHIPIEKLDTFISSLVHCIKPGGILILRDHDIQDEKGEAMAHAAHTVFNAIISNETLEAECKEYRNFQPLQYWIDILQQHGLEVSSERLVQDGDPSLNTMLKFTKTITSEEDKITSISASLKDQPGYERDISQSYLTTPEWHTVDISQEYGKFIEHTPFYEFPYMKNIQLYWDIFGKSFKTAQKKRGTFSTLTSSYTFMNFFIGSMMTVEFSLKSLVSLPVRAIFSGEEPNTIQLLINDPSNEITILEPKVKVKKTYEHSSFKLVEIPRYKEFLKTMHNLSDSAITILEIAGQKEIQCKVRYPKHLSINFDAIDGCKKEYDWQLPTNPTATYAAVTLNINKILKVLKAFEKQTIEIVYLHDF